MIITLEGLTAAGKTTIFNRLQQTFSDFKYLEEAASVLAKQGYKLGDNTTEETEQILTKEYLKQAEQALRYKREGFTVIIDRNYVSKLLYDYMYAVDKDDPQRLFEAVRLFKYVAKPDYYIWFWVDPDLANERIAQKKTNVQTNFSVDNLAKLQDSYELIFLLNEGVKPHKIDVTEKTIDQVVDEVKEFIDTITVNNKPTEQKRRLYHWCVACKEVAAKGKQRIGFPINCQHDESYWRRMYLNF